jgi:aminopeptidase N
MNESYWEPLCFLCSYDLHLTPDLAAFTFAGTCDVTLRIDTSKLDESNHSHILLHAKELSFASASYTILGTTASATDSDFAVSPTTTTNAEAVKASEIHANLATTTVKFVFATPFVVSPDKDASFIYLRLSIVYNGCLNNQMAGFYRSTYTDMSGAPQIMASTQFESLDARRCLPCVDEPAAKAVFGVSLTVSKSLDVLSNMPVASCTSQSMTMKRVTFMDTPIMSTYLLAMCVGQFDVISTRTQHGVLVSVYTPPGKAATHGTFALQAAAGALDLYDDFFGVPYPLPKLDMIAIPEFAMGAMEVSNNSIGIHCSSVGCMWQARVLTLCMIPTLCMIDPTVSPSRFIYRTGGWSRTGKSTC